MSIITKGYGLSGKIITKGYNAGVINPIYSDVSILQKNVNIYAKGSFHPPVYTGNTNLSINRIEFVGKAQNSPPVYSGQSSLKVTPALVSLGQNSSFDKNLLDIFVHKETLYVSSVHKETLYMTNKVVRINYVKINSIHNIIIF